MTFEEWFKLNSSDLPTRYSNPYGEEALKMAYEAGYKARVLDELVERGQDFDEYGHYGENNGPVGMSNPGDRDYEC